MVPMIDLLMVTISFLLITAVWVQYPRMEANAQVPGPSNAPPCEGAECKPDAKLHIDTSDPSKFVLVWKEGRTVVRTAEVARESAKAGKASFPTLASRVESEWRTAGMHRDASDRKLDQAVVHASNDMPYAELIAVMDAVAKPKRTLTGLPKPISAFEITFAVD
ncbi:TolR protein [Labilithrix luteola]|uniref:TolR protein n=2 Tax=Labilithrix luteola TaxID=1391654 RepID=A0A0K1QF82_9BACT|nr:TolR protein [Labilithrix luteola]